MREAPASLRSDEAPHINSASARFQVFAAASGIEGWGLFAAEAIPARRVVIEYTGEWITQAQANVRMMRDRCTLFEWDEDHVIDGAVGGSGAEYVNHGCQPNLAFRCLFRRVWLVSLRAIAAGEELTVDYQLADASPQPCRCGSPRCRGWINSAQEETTAPRF